MSEEQATTTEITVATRVENKIDEVCSHLQDAEAVSLIANWRVGNSLIDVYDAQSQGDTGLWGKGVMKEIAKGISEKLGKDLTESSLYDYVTVARGIDASMIEDLARTRGLNYSKLLRAVRRIPDESKRVEYLQETAELSVRDFQDKLNTDFPEQQAKDEWEKKNEEAKASGSGGGTRTGSGHGSSPSTPVNNSNKLTDKLLDQLDSVLLVVKDNDFETDKQVEKFCSVLEDLNIKLEGLVKTGIAVSEAISQYLGTKPIDLKKAEMKEATQKKASAAVTKTPPPKKEEKKDTPDDKPVEDSPGVEDVAAMAKAKAAQAAKKAAEAAKKKDG